MRRYEVEVTEYGKTKEKKLFNNQVDAFRYANSLEQRTGVKIAEVDGESYLLIANREEERHVDHLIRHKWPEEKPEETGRYLALIEREYNNFMTILEWHGGEWFRYTYEKEIFVRENDVTHWWHLPEVE